VKLAKKLEFMTKRTLLSLFLLLLVFPLPAMVLAQLKSGQNDTAKNQREITLTNVKQVARLTGNPLNAEVFPSPNSTAGDYDVGGTDLGIFWTMDSSRVGIFFGDTKGSDFRAGKGGGNGSNWRSNVLAFSNDVNLEDGLTISSMALDSNGKAREICAGAKNNPGKYNTSIPTAAIRAAGVDYVHYMNIYEWAGGNGRWLTNFSSLYASYDQGDTWERKKQITFKPDSKFSQICYAKRNGIVYMIGTQAGRGSAAFLARFKEEDIEEIGKYQYWNGDLKQWVRNKEHAATAVIPGPVGEASLIYHEKYERWIIAYSYDAAYDPKIGKKMHAVVYRDAKELNGNWSALKILASEKDFPGLYSPYFHPLKNQGDKLYFTISLWDPYNVFLMSTEVNIQ